jgi:hypothetical protein
MSLPIRQRHRRKPQPRFMAFERIQVSLLIISGAILPAAVEDPLPLERQRADGRVVVVTLLPLSLVVSSSPERLFAGGTGELVERLAEEFRAGLPPVHPLRLAARLGDRGDAGELLNVLGAFIPVASEPKATASRGAKAAPAPGRPSKRSWSGC